MIAFYVSKHTINIFSLFFWACMKSPTSRIRPLFGLSFCLEQARDKTKFVEWPTRCTQSRVTSIDTTRVLELFTPSLVILYFIYFVEIVLFNCKISSTISPKSAISSFYSAQISRIPTKCYFFRHLGRTGRKFAYYFYRETIYKYYYYIKINTISPEYNFYRRIKYRNSQRSRC